MRSDDYSSVTSADIDNALSDNDDDRDGSGRLPVPTTTTTGSGRHVAFAAEAVTDSVAGAPFDALRRSCFERGSAARRTLPALPTNPTSQLASDQFFQREMKTSTSTTRDASQRQQRPRSKSAGRTSTPKQDNASGSPVSRGVGPPLSASTPKSSKYLAPADDSQTSAARSPADPEAARGERLSNYGQGTLLVGRRGLCPPAGVPTRPAADGGSRLLCGRRSVDAAMSRNVSSSTGERDRLGELGTHDFGSGYVFAPSRRRCITPVNEARLADTASLFSGYQLRRPQLPSTPTSAVSDTETPSYSAGRRSLPRTGGVLPQGALPAGYPAPFYQPDSSHILSRSTASCSPGGPYWPLCGATARPQSSATSIVSGSADNIRKKRIMCCFILW